jgi:hypothetical protein
VTAPAENYALPPLDALCLRNWWPWTSQRWGEATDGVMDRREQRKRASVLLKGLKMPRPFDLDLFRIELQRLRGRAIVFVPVKTTAKSPCGLWVNTLDTDYVFFESSTSPLHQVHIALHELGHMLMGHRGIAPDSEEFLRKAMPTLDPAAMKRVLGRTAFTQVQEAEAESFATLVGEKGKILDIAHRRLELPADTSDVLSRLAAGLAEADDQW